MVPLFTLHECARYLHTPLSTLHSWAKPTSEVPLITTLPGAGRQATIPFVGFAEAFVLGALRKAGVPMQRIRPAVVRLNDEIGLDHALASERVYTDGAELIFDYASSTDDQQLLTVVRTGQEHFAEVIRDYLKPITYGNDGWAAKVRLPAYTRAEVTVDPTKLDSLCWCTVALESRTSSTASRRATASPKSRPTSMCRATRSRTSSELPSDSPLESFIDRSLGRHIVTGVLREAGATVHSMAEVYGERIGQGLADTEWLRNAGTAEMGCPYEGRQDPLPPGRARSFDGRGHSGVLTNQRESRRPGDGRAVRRTPGNDQRDRGNADRSFHLRRVCRLGAAALGLRS